MRYLRIVLIAMVSVAILTGLEQHAAALTLPLEQMAVPRYDVWAQLSREVRQELRSLMDEPEAEIERLLASTDAQEVGLALFVLEQRADLDRLVTLVDLIDDPRATIPYAAATAGPNEFIPVPQTLGEYLQHIYLVWLGTSWKEVIARKEEIRAMNPWSRPGPWLQKMQRVTRAGRNLHHSEDRHQLLALVQEQVSQLPADVRWAVIAQGRSHGYYSQEEAHAALLALDQTVRNQIMTGDPLAAHAGEIGWNVDKDLAEKARALLQASP